jgi:hypothetical protein
MATARRGHRRRVLLVGVAAVSAMVPVAAGAGTYGARADKRVVVSQVSKLADWSSGEAWVVADPRSSRRLTAVWTTFPYKAFGSAVTTPPGPHPVACGVGYSDDGGRTWQETTLPFQPAALPSNAGGCADPTLVTDGRGTLYSVFNGGSLLPGAGGTGASLPSLVSFSTSRDGGHTWRTPTKVWSVEDGPGNSAVTGSLDLAFDRPWLVLDESTDTIYTSISDDVAVERVVLASHDRGRTWSMPRPLDPDGQSVWADSISAAHGVLAAAYSVDPSSPTYQASPAPTVRCDRICAVFETSTDDGTTWRRHVLPARTVGSTTVGGLTAPGVQTAADPSTKRHFAVLLPATDSSTQIWMTRDSGRTWTRAFTVTARAGGTVTKPWVAFGRNGALGVVWRTVHADDTYDVYAAVSTDGGRSFGGTVRLTRSPAPPDIMPGAPGDDCACNLSIDGTYLYTTWGDSRTGQRQVWFARYPY